MKQNLAYLSSTKGNQYSESLKLRMFCLEETSIASIIFNNQNEIIYANKAACKLLNYTKEELLAIKMNELNLSCNITTWEDFWNILKNEKYIKMQSECHKKGNSSVLCELRTSYLNYNEQELGFTQIIDITEYKKIETNLNQKNIEAEQELKQKTNQLKEAILFLQEANNHKNNFFSNVSHELRTPLNAIIGFSELLSHPSFGMLNFQQQEYANLINESANNLLDLINNILDISKSSLNSFTPNIQKIQPYKIIKNIISLMHSDFENQNIKLVETYDPEVVYILADPDLLSQIITHLLSNALKFTPMGGIVEIKTEKTNNKFARISVIDNGIGIKNEEKDKIFEEFYQADIVKAENIGGIGIGLSISKKFVEMQNGTISVISKEGEGSTFWFTLPLNHGKTIEPSNIVSFNSRRMLNPKNKLIMIAEDNPVNQKLIVDILNVRGYQLVMAKDGLEALKTAKTKMPDLILMDIIMPNLNGMEVVKNLRRLPEFKNTPIIALTGCISTKEKQKHLACGFNEQIDKPFKIDKLVNTVEKFLLES